MTRIALSAAAILVAMGSAFAGSDHYNSGNASQPVAPVANVDKAYTSSVRKSDTAQKKSAATKVPTDFGIAESGQGIWGN